ncbi:MAG: hypothetical protein JRH18_02540 [Deltaproteobacteria bacterium]|nr:hypothetical protein [Deltaproteobacteria bacterium]MBW1994909.1 hypothetical protein [Deltaproteobacteria bacterium]MBW2150527.1 hypothetical protein [Deltaproteobacteria bacterium]
MFSVQGFRVQERKRIYRGCWWTRIDTLGGGLQSVGIGDRDEGVFLFITRLKSTSISPSTARIAAYTRSVSTTCSTGWKSHLRSK